MRECVFVSIYRHRSSFEQVWRDAMNKNVGMTIYGNMDMAGIQITFENRKRVAQTLM